MGLSLGYFMPEAQAQLPKVPKVPKVGGGKKNDKPRVSEDAKVNAKKDPRESGYKPKTDQEWACSQLANSIKSAPERIENALADFEKGTNNYVKSDIEAYRKNVEEGEAQKCTNFDVKAEKAKLEAFEARLNKALAKRTADEAAKDKEKTTRREIADLLEQVQSNMLASISGFEANSPVSTKYFLSYTGKTIETLKALDLKNKMAEYKALATKYDDKNMLKVLARLEGANDDTWRERNDAVFKTVTDLHTKKNSNFMVYLWSNAMVELGGEILKFNPQHGAFQSRHEAYKRYLNETKQQMKSLITSPVHEKNLGKIVFANSEIKIKQENPAAFKTEFKSSDFVYGMVYLPLTKTEVSKMTSGGLSLRVYKEDGKEAEVFIQHEFQSDFMKDGDGYMPIYILVDAYKHAKEFTFTPQMFRSAEKLDKLPYNKNKLKVVAELNGLPVAEGSLVLDFTDGPGILNDMYEKQKKLEFTLRTPPTVKHKDPAFEGQALAHYNSKKPAGVKIHRINSRWDWSEKYKDVLVNSKVVKVLDYRDRSFVIVYTAANGKCYWTSSTASQTYVNGAYKPTVWTSQSFTEDNEIPCQNINR